MKSKFVLCCLFILVTGHCFAQSIKKVKIEELVSYIKSSEHPLIINFWATWCAPCVEEIPWFQKALKVNDSSNIELVLVSLDFPESYEKKVIAFAQKNKLDAKLLWLDETNADHFCPQIDSNWFGTIPVTLFINNRTGYRKFYDDQVPEKELTTIIDEMLK